MSDLRGHHRHGGRAAWTTGDSRAILKPPGRKHAGITRAPRDRFAATLPLTERHQKVLALLTAEPMRPAEVAAQASWTASSVVSTLYALQDRGLVVRIPRKGWYAVALGKAAENAAAQGGSVPDVLPVPVITALLRIVRAQEPRDGDEDVLFDEFGCCDPRAVMMQAARRVLGGGGGSWSQVDAALVEMIRERASQTRQEAA